MTDRELLELAAKAAGIDIATWSNCQAGGFQTQQSAEGRFWNPLTDDGDALRLAVKLGGVTLNFYSQACFVSRYEGEETICEELAADPYAATRRAITRAAAAIGEDKP